MRFFSPNLQFDIPLSPLQLTPKEYASWYYVLPKRKVRFRKELQRSEGDIVNLSFTNLEFSSIHSVICIKWQTQLYTLVMEPYSHPAVFVTFYYVLLTDFILLKYMMR